jgi:hypothetical protein
MTANDYTWSVPLNVAVKLDGPALHLRPPDGAALLEVADRIPWPRVRLVTLPLDDFPRLEAYHNRARWNLRWEGFDVGHLLDLLPLLRRRTVTVLVAADDPQLYDKMVVGESLSVQMRLALRDPGSVDLAALNRLVSYVLLTGARRAVPIEPIVSMVQTAAGRERQTLWDFADENPRRNVYVDDAGRVCLSERFDRATHDYGALADLQEEDLERTAGYRLLADYAEAQFRDQTPCSECRAFPLCGGWLRYVERDYDCEVWQLVLGALQDAVGETERNKELAQRVGGPASSGKGGGKRRRDTAGRS